MNGILHKNISNIKKLIVKDIIFAKSYLSFRAGYNIFCGIMSFRNRNIAAVTVNASVTNITRSFMYNRFTNGNRFGEKFITLITTNFNGIQKVSGLRGIWVTWERKLVSIKVAQVLEKVLSILKVARVAGSVNL